MVNAAGLTHRVDLPGGWPSLLKSHQPRSLVLRRRFGLPRILDADESVFLICEFNTAPALSLNGQPIESEHRHNNVAEWDATGLLQQRNVLELSFNESKRGAHEVSGVIDDPLTSCAAPSVALEIRGPVFLRNVKATESGWTGQVVGEDRKHLEVHLLAQGRAVARIPVQANQSFSVERPAELPDGAYNPQAPPWTLELIEMANRWYSLDVPGPAR